MEILDGGECLLGGDFLGMSIVRVSESVFWSIVFVLVCVFPG